MSTQKSTTPIYFRCERLNIVVVLPSKDETICFGDKNNSSAFQVTYAYTHTYAEQLEHMKEFQDEVCARVVTVNR